MSPASFFAPKRAAVLAAVVFVALAGYAGKRVTRPATWTDWFVTSDRRAARAERAGDFAGAAREYRDPFRRAVALFRAGDFKSSAAEFARFQNNPEADYDRGCALVMTGLYDQAVAAFDDALKLKPDWKEAKDNREIARVRAKMLEKKGGDESGGKEKADSFAFDADKKENTGEKEASPEKSGDTDDALQEAWLRRVDTKPGDFLRAKFAAQLSDRTPEAEKGKKP